MVFLRIAAQQYGAGNGRARLGLESRRHWTLHGSAFLLLAPFAPLGFAADARPRALPPRCGLLVSGRWAYPRPGCPLTWLEPHTYTLEWRTNVGAISRWMGRTCLITPHAPRGPLGFIAWIDNQYAVVTPQGRFGFGLVATTERQWLALAG